MPAVSLISCEVIAKVRKYVFGPVRESNPGPLAPKARIMPLDQQAFAYIKVLNILVRKKYRFQLVTRNTCHTYVYLKI